MGKERVRWRLAQEGLQSVQMVTLSDFTVVNVSVCRRALGRVVVVLSAKAYEKLETRIRNVWLCCFDSVLHSSREGPSPSLIVMLWLKHVGF
jgi:hypothetical protein